MQILMLKARWQPVKTALFMLNLALATALPAQPADTGMVTIHEGWFKMGDSADLTPNVTPHQVWVSTFQMESNLVSYQLWHTVYTYATANGYTFSTNAAAFGPNHPVQSITWYDAVKWCNARSQMDSFTPCYSDNQGNIYTNGNVALTSGNVNWTANGYRLPTEAEWEKAARGGLAATNRYPLGMTITHSQACYNSPMVLASPGDLGPPSIAPGGTVPVGTFRPNAFGLFDMAGNVFEWCWDYFSPTYYSSTPTNNPQGPASGSARVTRGGSWNSYAISIRCAARGNGSPAAGGNICGFRCVRNAASSTPALTTPVLQGQLTNTTLLYYGMNLGNIDTNNFTANAFVDPNNNNPVPGHYTILSPQTFPPAGSYSLQVTYTPDDPTTYNTVTTNASVTVNQTTPVITVPPTPGAIPAGFVVTISSLTGGLATNYYKHANVVGHFAFTAADAAVVQSASGITVPVMFVPNDSANYTGDAQTSVGVPVASLGGQTTNVIIKIKPAAAAINYGQTLNTNNSKLSGTFTNKFGTVVPGVLTFADPTVTPYAGTTNVLVTFTPNDSNYNPLTTNVNVVVKKALPVLTPPTASSITSGQTLASSSLTGGAATNGFNLVHVDGTFVFTTTTIKPNAGTTNVGVTFTPTDTANYSNATTKVSVVVFGPKTNTVFLVSLAATPIVYGQALNTNNSHLNGVFTNKSGTAMSGALTFANPAIVPGIGTTNVWVIFTPSNPSYKNSTNLVSVLVTPATLVITANNAIWDASSPAPAFTVKCSGLAAQDIKPGADINNLVGTNTVFGTNLYVWTPAADNLSLLPNNTYTNFIIPILVGSTNKNYIVSYQWGNLTITGNTFAAPPTTPAVSNNFVTSASLKSFLNTYNVDQSGLNTVLAHYWAHSPPYIANTAFPQQTNLCFTVTNFSFSVQYSTDLNNWQNLGGDAKILFTDPNAAGGQKFYRLVGATNQ